MFLNSEQQQVFFNNYLPLLYFASVYGGILSPGSKIKDFQSTSIEQKLEARNLVFEDDELIRDYEEHNRSFIEQSLPGFLDNVENGILEKFVILKETKSAAVFLSIETKNFYHVHGVTQSLSSIVAPIPCVIQTAIFNFGEIIVCDGLIAKETNLGPNYKRQFLEDYKMAKKNKEIIEKL
jgi:hypothetical protein